MEIIWLVVLICAVIVEAFTTQLVAIWFLPAAIVSIILAFCGTPIWVQVLVFFLVAALGLVLSRTIFRRFFNKTTHHKFNADDVIGEKCVVTTRIDNLAGSGEVKINGLFWAARSANADIIFEENAVVTVIAIEGVKVICQ